jgi:hypothetical protein
MVFVLNLDKKDDIIGYYFSYMTCMTFMTKKENLFKKNLY